MMAVIRLTDRLAAAESTTSLVLLAVGEGLLIGLLAALSVSLVVGLLMLGMTAVRWVRLGGVFLVGSRVPGDYDDEQLLNRMEEIHIGDMSVEDRQQYESARAFFQQYPPASVNTDFSLSDFFRIQEKGVAAWEFQPEVERVGIMVEGRTEIEFIDSIPCSVQTNYPAPKQNEHYYWEAKIMGLAEGTQVAVGMAIKPYPPFQLPGHHRHSFAYQSDGQLFINQPFQSHPYSLGQPLQQGDVIGICYKPRHGTVYFTHNGARHQPFDVRKDVNWFPTIGATGPCEVHVNFGQRGYVFIEANVKRWRFAPPTGTLAPPPAYGQEAGYQLLEAGAVDPVTAPSVCASPGPGLGPRSGYSPAPISLGILSSVDGNEDRHGARQPMLPPKYEDVEAGPSGTAPPPSPPVAYDTLMERERLEREVTPPR